MPETTGAGAGRERGAAALLFAVSSFVLIAMIALVVDLGYAYYSQQRLQDTLDLAAIAGARNLTDSSTGQLLAAETAARNVLNTNYTSSGETLTLSLGCNQPTAPRHVNLCFGNYMARDNSGALNPVSARFVPGGTSYNAVRLYAMAESPSFFSRVFRDGALDVGASSTAAKGNSPVAQLTIRSGLATLGTSNSALLGPVFGLLGGNVNLSAINYSGLVSTQINLLTFMDTLIGMGGLGLNLAAGQYEQLLGSSISVNNLLSAAITAVGPGTTAGVALTAMQTGLSSTVKSTTVQLGSLIDLQTGTPTSGLDMGLNAVDLVQGVLLAANGSSALETSGVTLSTAGINSLLSAVGGVMPSGLQSLLTTLAPLTSILGGAATVTLKLKVIEAPQLSAIGNPVLAKAGADKRTGPDAIYVRTGQIRVYIAIQLPIMSTLSSLINAVTTLTNSSALVSALNNALSLNIFGVLSDVLGALLPIPQAKKFIDIQILPSPRVDVSLDLAHGEAYVTDYSCPADPKSLTVQAASSVAEVRLGKIDPATVFSSKTPPSITPVPIIDIGTKTCTVTCLLLLCSSNCGARTPFAGGGLGLYANSSVAGKTYTPYAFANPPDMGQATVYHSYSLSDVVSSLKTTLGNIKLESYAPAGGTNLLSTILTVVSSLINTLVTIINPVITLLAGVLDPIVNFLLNLLGLSVANIDVGANMTCGSGGARLVN